MTIRLTKGVASTSRRSPSHRGDPSSMAGEAAAAVASQPARVAARGRRRGSRVAPVHGTVAIGQARGAGGGGAATEGDRVRGEVAGAGQRVPALRAVPGGDAGRTGALPSPATVRRRLRVRWGRLAAAVVAVYLLAGFVLQQWALWQARQELRALDQQLAALRARQRELQEAADRVDDPAYVDETARRRLGLVKPGETVIQLVEPPASSEEAGSGEAPSPAAP